MVDFLCAFATISCVCFVPLPQEQDTSLFLASSWNDNGFVGVSKDPAALRRTSYFPGLGWLLPRRLFNDEVRPRSLVSSARLLDDVITINGRGFECRLHCIWNRC